MRIQPTTRTRHGRAAALAILGLTASASTPMAATVLVANEGVDSAACGRKAAPCRSISRGITNALAGDTIVVGPGHYGDLNGNGTLGEPGEESPSPDIFPAMIKIDKRLSVVSRDGASTTVIDARGAIGVTYVVRIAADAVSFGKRKKGFTVIGTDRNNGVLVGPEVSGAIVAGNQISGCTYGMAMTGSHLAIGNVARDNGSAGFFLARGARATGNDAVGNFDWGIYTDLEGVELVGNRLTSNGVGVQAAGSANAANSVIRGNVATGNGTGFALGGTGHRVTGNAAIRNLESGFFIEGTDMIISGNALIGNALAGIEISAAAGAVTLTKNNFVGNRRASDGLRCGIFNFSSAPLDARGSYWGAPTGPGPAPADEACADTVTGTITVAPFATKALKVATKPPLVD